MAKLREPLSIEFVVNQFLKKIDKDKLLLQLDNHIKNYSNYIKSDITPDGDNLGYKKMIRIN